MSGSVTLLALTLWIGSPATQPSTAEPVRLGDWRPAGIAEAVPFALNAQAKQVSVWGRGNEAPRAYLDEFLPALFERTCVIQEIDLAEGVMEWIFTGPHGGITLRVGAGRVELLQRFYDSFGYNAFEDGKIKADRHPEKVWQWSGVKYQGRLRAITVKLDHRLGLDVLLNGRPALHQTCLFEVSRHQIRIVGPQGSVSGTMTSPAARHTRLTLDPARRHQRIIGFGGITTPTAYRQLSVAGKRRWWDLVCEYNLLIQREYPVGTRLKPAMDNWDTLADATPHYYGDNFPNGEISDFDYIRTLRQLNGLVFFEFWGLPPWAMKPMTDSAGRLYPEAPDIDAYTRAMVRYCEASNAATGSPPDVVGIQNEKPQPAEVWYDMTRALRQRLDEAGFHDVRIHLADAGSLADGVRRLARFKENPEVYSLIDYPATHMYDYQAAFTDPDSFDDTLEAWQELAKGKPFLSTELCINRGQYQLGSYRLALLMGQLYHKNLTITDAAAICYCWTLLNVVQPSYGASRSLMVPDAANGFIPTASSHQLRVFGAFTRRLPRGMTRIDAVSSSRDLLASAYIDDTGGGTVILLNRDVASHTVTLPRATMRLTRIEQVDPYHANTPEPLPQSVEDEELSVSVAPGSIVTLTSMELGRLPVHFAIQDR